MKKTKPTTARAAKLRPLWKCPDCGERFVTRNIWHSCGKYTLEELFARSDPNVIRLFRKFAKMVRACGPVRMIPQKTRVVFQVRVRFAGAVPRKSHLLISFALPYHADDARVVKLEKYGAHFQAHTLKISTEAELDQQIQLWLKDSYQVGAQSFLPDNKESTPTLFKDSRRTR